MLHIDLALKYQIFKNVRNRMEKLEKFMIQVSILNTVESRFKKDFGSGQNLS